MDVYELDQYDPVLLDQYDPVLLQSLAGSTLFYVNLETNYTHN